MKFSITKSEFLDGLNNVARVIAPNTTFEILKGIKLELLSDRLILKTSDSLVSIEHTIYATKEDKEIITIFSEGQIVLPSRDFIEIVRKAPTDIIDFETNDTYIKISSGKSEFNIKGFEGEEFPDFPVISKDNSFKLNAKLFSSIIKETLFSTAQNDQRPMLEGVNFVLNNRIFTATSTDSYRLSRRTVVLDESYADKEFNMIIPRKALTYFLRMIDGSLGDVEIFYENNRIVLYFENVVYTVLLISGKYPNTDKLIPTIFECVVTVDSKELYNTVDRISIMSRDDKDDIIKLVITNNNLEISSQSKDFGSAVEEITVEADLEEDKFEISVSGKYIKDAISAVAAEKIIIKFSGELTAFIIQPSDYHRDIIELILPVRTY